MAAKPIAARPFFRSIIDSNPFYLISACCMLAGCLALTNSLSWVSIPTPRLLILIGTLNAYEFALIGLSAYLVLRRGLRRDAFMLILLEAFFLADVTFLGAEIATRKFAIGLIISAAIFLAAVVKLAIILRVIGAKRPYAQFAFIVLQLAAIVSLPIIFARHDDGSLPPVFFYAAWWVVGLMPAVYQVLVKCFGPRDLLQPLPRILLIYLVVPWLSLAAHLGILHYVYGVPFYGAMAAPILLALAMVLEAAAPSSLLSRRDLVLLRALLPLAAIFVSLSNPAELALLHRHAFTALQLACAGAYLELVYFFQRRLWIHYLFAGGAIMLFNAYGPTFNQMENWSISAWNQITAMIYRIMPSTAEGWGECFVAAAFVFLALGAIISLRRTVSPPDS